MSSLWLTISYENQDHKSKLSFLKGESLLLLCRRAGIALDAPCGGKGICGKCRVRFVEGAPLPTPAERRHLRAEELRAGVRLACAAKPVQDCEIRLPGAVCPAADSPAGASDADAPLAGGFDAVASRGQALWLPGETDADKNDCFVAADIGTTTLVMELRKASDGSVINTYKAVNAQRRYGADVLTRMEASLTGKRETLAKLVREQLAEGLGSLGGSPLFMTIASNTAMTHLLMGYDVSTLARAPFVPVTLEEIVTTIGGLTTYILPGFSAFVGGDIAAGVYAVENPVRQDVSPCWRLLLDLGTNAELMLFGGGQAVCTAAAAGPAFDGAAGTGFFGSDMIAELAGLLEQGIVDETGLLADPYFETGVLLKKKEGEMHISQKQIRDLQLAKAAVRAGMEILPQKAGIRLPDIERVYLAGGFGCYLDVGAAVRIGLVPPELAEKTVTCSNTALPGAALYAKRILGKEKRGLPLQAQAVNLAEEEKFAEYYVNCMELRELPAGAPTPYGCRS